ncbi:MAG: alanine dehydrogenase [Deltaproteobacteria bacterium]|nr:alanine dehydrogenase [Deltaproteobacteria bacterium]
MIIGVPKESKEREYRVALTPGGARTLVSAGHRVLVQKGAGLGSGFTDREYATEGAAIVSSLQQVLKKSELVVKVKEPTPLEINYFREGQALFTYLHLAAIPQTARLLIKKKITAIGYETVQMEDGSLPLLKPMSEVAGRLSVQIGAHYLRKDEGGKGKLLGGVTGVEPAVVTILGGGIVGSQATQVAVGMGAKVYVIDRSVERLAHYEELYRGRVTTLVSHPKTLEEKIAETDLLVGAVLIPGAKAPKLITGKMVKMMKPGSVIVDVSVDQGGCVETTRPTTHMKPVYEVYGVLHYGVTNIPGCVPQTSTVGLTNVTLPYILKLAEMGIDEAVEKIPELGRGLNIWRGEVVHAGVRESLGNIPVEVKGDWRLRMLKS